MNSFTTAQSMKHLNEYRFVEHEAKDKYGLLIATAWKEFSLINYAYGNEQR